jgi:hypothetical protein
LKHDFIAGSAFTNAAVFLLNVGVYNAVYGARTVVSPVECSEIALLRGLLNAVTAPGTECAIHETTTVRCVVERRIAAAMRRVTVVALFIAIFHTIAAIRCELTVNGAVAIGPVIDAIAGFWRLNDPVATHGGNAAARVARCTGSIAVVGTLVALFAIGRVNDTIAAV